MIRSALTNNPLRMAVHFALIAVVLFSLATIAMAQAQETAARPDRGTGSGSYSVSDVESIDLKNGNVNLSIPLAGLPPIAGGKLSWMLRATYNSKLWDVTRYQVKQTEPPLYDYNVDSIQLNDNGGGWRIGAAYGIRFRDSHEDYDWAQITNTSDPDYNLLYQHPNWHKRFLLTPDGAEHELKPYGHAPFPGWKEFLRGYYRDNPDEAGQPVSYYTIDGSYIWAKIYPSNDPGGKWAEIYMPDGTAIHMFNSGVQKIVDTNGNSIKIFSDTNGTHYQDEQTGRELRVTFDPAGNGGQGQSQVWYQTVGGAWIAVTINFGTTYVQGKTLWTNVPQEEGGHCENPTINWTSVGVAVVREIVFPQTESGQPGQKYTFTYNSDSTQPVDLQWWPTCEVSGTITTASSGWGSLKEMVTPSGARVNYSYDLDTTHELVDPNNAARERITTKAITHDGIIDTWTYDNPTYSVINPDGSTIAEFRYPQDPGFGSVFGGGNGLGGLTYKTIHSGQLVIERRWIRKQFSGGDDTQTGFGLAVFNPLVSEEYTTLLNTSGASVKMSAKKFDYDYNGNLTQQTDYDWFDPALVSRDAQGVPTGVPGVATVLRGVSNGYHNPAPSSSSANVYAKRSLSTVTPLILNALHQSTQGPSVTQLSYDGQVYGVAPTVGNLTAQSVWDDLDNKWIASSQTYGAYGNLATKTNPLGKVTQFYYDDATHAVPNRVVVDPQNGTGTQTTTTAFDYSTGLVTSQTDANLIVSTIDYTNQLLGAVDPFGRPGIIKGPLVNGQQHWVTTKYVDRLRQVIQASDLTTQNDQLLKTKTTSDELGRVILSEQTEDGTNYSISARSVYEQMGKISYSSNPARSTGASTDGWTRATSDTAGRVIEVATFSGATQPAATGYTNGTGQVSTAYDANFTTVTDQAGKVRRSMVDALGRLVRLDEPITGNNLGSTASPTQPTSYSYSVLGNLLTVTQGVQNRTFTYDSLSRLRTALNPESGTISYQYDDNSNLTQKSDARSITTTFTYDALNRLTLKNYSETTPDVAYFYDTQTLPAGAPIFDRGYAKGRLVGVTYGGGSAGTYRGYDARGSVLRQFQQTDAVNYLTEAAYSLSGSMQSQTYPSIPGAGDRRTISYANDNAGRLASLSSAATSYAAAASVSSIGYSAPGGLSSETYGNNLIHGVTYNSRLQTNEIKLGTSGAPAANVSITYNYGTTANNGNLQSTSYAGGGLSYTQTFGYDELNRLTTSQEGASWSQTNSYDKYGNRSIVGGALSFTASNNRITGWSYDVAGNLLNDGAHGYTFDAENKISKVDGVSAYVYDGDGQRVRKLVNENLRFIYGIGGQQIAEFDGSSGALKKEYVYGPSGLVATIEPTAVNANSTRYTTSDHLGSPRLVTNSSAGVISRHDYMPFGEELFNGGRTFGMGYGTTDGLRQKFTSYERDNETGLDYAKARYMSSTQGRFTSPDPYVIFFEMKRGKDAQEQLEMLYEYIGQPQNWARYTYGLNNPLKHTDPTGMRPPGRNERAALARLDQLAGQAEADGDSDLANGLRAARNAIAGVINGLGRGQESVGVNVAVNAILNVGNSNYANSSTVTIGTRAGTVTIGSGQNKCNIFVAATHAGGAGLGFTRNGQRNSRGYPLLNGSAPVANWLGDARDRQNLTNLSVVTDGSLRPGDIVAWRTQGGTGQGHSTIHIGGNVLVYAGGPPDGTPQTKTLNYVNGNMMNSSHEPAVVRRYNGKP